MFGGQARTSYRRVDSFEVTTGVCVSGIHRMATQVKSSIKSMTSKSKSSLKSSIQIQSHVPRKKGSVIAIIVVVCQR